MTIPTTAADQVSDSWPHAPIVSTLLRTALSTNGTASRTSPEAGQLNSRFGANFDGTEKDLTRPTAAAPFAALVLAFICALMITRIRRLELASDRHSGVTCSEQIAIALIEAAAWMVPVWICAAGCILFTSPQAMSADLSVIALAATRIPAAICLGGVLGAVIGVALIRERDLFHYFKAR